MPTPQTRTQAIDTFWTQCKADGESICLNYSDLIAFKGPPSQDNDPTGMGWAPLPPSSMQPAIEKSQKTMYGRVRSLCQMILSILCIALNMQALHT
jgi:hypothetical protein